MLRGSARLKSVMRSNGLRRQTGNTLRCVQTMSRFQSQIRLRRLKMTEENQKIQKHLQLKQEREVEFAKEAEVMMNTSQIFFIHEIIDICS